MYIALEIGIELWTDFTVTILPMVGLKRGTIRTDYMYLAIAGALDRGPDVPCQFLKWIFRMSLFRILPDIISPVDFKKCLCCFLL